MREAAGDLWAWDDPPGSVVARCITTNGCVNKNGEAVMGCGTALQARERFGVPLAKRLGDYLLLYGNHVHGFAPNPKKGRPYWLLTFPVKPTFGPDGEPGWAVPAEPGIIRQSCEELLVFTLGMLSDGGTIVLPRPGCGNGGLDWNDVRPIVADTLDQEVRFDEEPVLRSIGDRFVVVELP